MAETNEEIIKENRKYIAEQKADFPNFCHSAVDYLAKTTNRLEVAEEKIEQQQNCIRELLDACKATKQRIAFIGLPSEPTNKDGPDWSKEIALLEPTIASALAMLKSTTEKTKTKERIITKEYEGVRCGHCGGRSKIGEVWLISEKDWIGDNPICYGHKRCVETAIAKAEELTE